MTKITITPERKADISPDMIGLFFEDINYAADGGLYAELIENRAFSFLECFGDKAVGYTQTPAPSFAWSYLMEGSMMEFFTDGGRSKTNPNWLRFTASSEGDGFLNAAYEGVNVTKGSVYNASVIARVPDGGEINISLSVGDACADLKISGCKWRKYDVQLKALSDLRYSKFTVTFKNAGTADFDFISLIPADAVAGLFRRDLFDMLDDMNPRFIRFPGGCIVEGNGLANRYNWKNSVDGRIEAGIQIPDSLCMDCDYNPTVGDVSERTPNWNRWSVHGNNASQNKLEGKFKFYNQTLGMGFYEYFVLCELLGAKPLPVLGVALACQYQSDELVERSDPEYQRYIQDVLDLIEFANGGADTVWGARRIAMGHEKPFNLELVGIGNEQWQTDKVDFFERYTDFEKAVHEKYPEIKLIGSAGPNVNSIAHESAWKYYSDSAKTNPNHAYAVDEHYYVDTGWLCFNDTFYDNYPRDVKVFAGEYAAHSRMGDYLKENTWNGACCEAAFLTGVQRNSDVVVLASYAPLFARVNYTQWSPDLIWFDDQKAWGSPSYYVQKIFARNMGSYNLESIIETYDKFVYRAVSYDETTKEIIVKLVNSSDRAKDITLSFDGFSLRGKASVIEMTGERNEVNSPDNTDNIVPVCFDMEICENTKILMKPDSFLTIRIPAEI